MPFLPPNQQRQSTEGKIMLLKFLFDPPLFGLARMTGPKWSNSSQAVLLLGLIIIIIIITTIENIYIAQVRKGHKCAITYTHAEI